MKLVCKKKPEPAKTKKSSGYTLIEVLMAMSILSVGLLAVGGMQMSAIQSNQSARKTTEANDWASVTMERLINSSYNDEELDMGVHKDPENPRGNIFNVSWLVDHGPAVQTKKIVVTVRYPDKGKNRTVSLEFLKSNPDPFFP
jgi:type IV pilus assembly protein PilV